MFGPPLPVSALELRERVDEGPREVQNRRGDNDGRGGIFFGNDVVPQQRERREDGGEPDQHDERDLLDGELPRQEPVGHGVQPDRVDRAVEDEEGGLMVAASICGGRRHATAVLPQQQQGDVPGENGQRFSCEDRRPETRPRLHGSKLLLAVHDDVS
eukprot:scaffold3789_cov44-Attheya_sp.AAC.5